MNFELSDEQRMIQDSIIRFVQDNYSQSQRKAIAASETGYSRSYWQQFSDLGWLSIPFDEEYGGMGGGVVETMLLMQELGRGNVLEPIVPTVLMFGGLVQAAGTDKLKQSIIPTIISGDLQGAFAWAESQSRFDPANIQTLATQVGDGWRVNGEKIVVLNGGAADKLIVASRTSGKSMDEKGITLLLVDAKAAGLVRVPVRLTDGRGAANIRFENVRAEAVVGNIDDGFAPMKSVLDRAMLAVCADALGAIEALNSQTLEYLKTRRQFGVPIGSFQALQHRMVSMFGACENTRSLLYRAVCTAEAGDEDAERSLLALKVMVGEAGRQIWGEAIQMHGGMGVTEELVVGTYVKRLMIANTLFGDADYHRSRFIGFSRETEAAA